jgi:hypothetical protein
MFIEKRNFKVWPYIALEIVYVPNFNEIQVSY